MSDLLCLALLALACLLIWKRLKEDKQTAMTFEQKIEAACFKTGVDGCLTPD
jgi:hypothetical protein